MKPWTAFSPAPSHARPPRSRGQSTFSPLPRRSVPCVSVRSPDVICHSQTPPPRLSMVGTRCRGRTQVPATSPAPRDRLAKRPLRTHTPGRGTHRCHRGGARQGRAVLRQRGRAAEDLCRPSGHRRRKRPPVQRAAGADRRADSIGREADGAGRGQPGPSAQP